MVDLRLSRDYFVITLVHVVVIQSDLASKETFVLRRRAGKTLK